MKRVKLDFLIMPNGKINKLSSEALIKIWIDQSFGIIGKSYGGKVLEIKQKFNEEQGYYAEWENLKTNSTTNLKLLRNSHSA